MDKDLYNYLNLHDFTGRVQNALTLRVFGVGSWNLNSVQISYKTLYFYDRVRHPTTWCPTIQDTEKEYKTKSDIQDTFRSGMFFINIGIIALCLCQEVVRVIPIVDVYVFVVQIAWHTRHRAWIQDKFQRTRQISDWHVRCSFHRYGYFESDYLCRKVVRIILMSGFLVFCSKNSLTYKTQDIDTRQNVMYKTDFW